jgi:hypothetical protein
MLQKLESLSKLLILHIKILLRNLIIKRRALKIEKNSFVLYNKVFTSIKDKRIVKNLIQKPSFFNWINSESNYKKIFENNEQYLNEITQKGTNIIDNNLEIFELNYEFSNQIDWFFSFYDNKKWPEKYFWDFNCSSLGPNTDAKYVFELNRFNYLPTLGLLFVYTRNELYLKKGISLIDDWIKKNPFNIGINWSNGLEIATRITNWTIFIVQTIDSDIISGKKLSEIYYSLFQHFLALINLFNPNKYNHAIGEAFGSYLFSYLFKENNYFKKYYVKSKKFLKKQLKRQFLSDGVNIEMSSNYHRYVLEFYVFMYLINPYEFDNEEREILRNAFIFLLWTVLPNNHHINIGDTDDSHIIPSIFFDNEDKLEILILANNLLDLRFPIQEFNKINLSSLNQFVSNYYPIKNKSDFNEKFHFFHESGYFFCRNDWSNNASYLFFDMGTYCSPNGQHDHSDISNIVFYYKGKPILVDTGTFRYNIPFHERKNIRKSSNHNVLVINSLDQAYQLHTFKWDRLPKVKRSFKEKNDLYDCEVIHNGYKRFLTKRKVSILKTLEQIYITDSVIVVRKIKEKNLNFHIYFHFHPTTKLKIIENGFLINDDLVLISLNDEKPNLTISDYQFSENYGYKKPAPCGKFSYCIKNNGDFIKNSVIFEKKFKIYSISNGEI